MTREYTREEVETMARHGDEEASSALRRAGKGERRFFARDGGRFIILPVEKEFEGCEGCGSLRLNSWGGCDTLNCPGVPCE